MQFLYPRVSGKGRPVVRNSGCRYLSQVIYTLPRSISDLIATIRRFSKTLSSITEHRTLSSAALLSD